MLIFRKPKKQLYTNEFKSWIFGALAQPKIQLLNSFVYKYEVIYCDWYDLLLSSLDSHLKWSLGGEERRGTKRSAQLSNLFFSDI